MTTITRRTAAVVAAVLMWGSGLTAQTPTDTTQRRQQRTLDSLAMVLRSMQARIDSLVRAGRGADTAAGDALANLRAAAQAAAGDSAPAAAPAAARLGQNALNPELTVTGNLRAEVFRPGPQAGNFTDREFEIGLQSALDPFSTAKVFLSIEDGVLGLEEGYVYWAGLPGHTRLDVGRFRQTFGELNRWHLHGVSTDEYPLVIRRFAGDEGLGGAGVSLYAPLPFSGRAGTWELTVQGTVGSNEVLFAGGDRPSVLGQLSGFWQLSRATFAQVSISGLRGTNPDTGLTTTAGALAARVTWRPPERGTSREFTLRGELWALRRAFAVPSGPAFDRTRLGAYADVTWRLGRRWVAGARGDWVQSPEPGPLATEWALTPSLTFWQSEFVYVRGLFERARAAGGATADRLAIQVVFAMGPHKHELF